MKLAIKLLDVLCTSYQINDYTKILNDVLTRIDESYDEDTDIEIYDMHNIVESVLEMKIIQLLQKCIRNIEIIKRILYT